MKRILTNVIFDKTAKTVTFTELTTIELARILAIVDTTNNTIIFNCADATLGGTVATNVLTLTYNTNTVTFANTDKLQVTYDVPKYSDRRTLTQTLASLANATSQQSTLITKPEAWDYVMVMYKIKSGASTPTVGTTIECYILESDGTTADDFAGASDAAITIENSQLIGTAVVTATANKNFSLKAKYGPLTPTWGTAIKNNIGQALSSTEGDHVKGYVYFNL
jgi:hypothetical protein